MHLLKRWVPENSVIFELGTGLGHFLRHASQSYQCQGCDINEYGAQETQKKVPGLNIQVGSYECIPADPGPDAVVALDVLEHIPDLDEALEVIHQRLADEGFLVGVVPVYDGPFGWLVHLLDKDPTHLSKFSRKQWQDKLKEHGYQIVETGGILRRYILNRYYLHLTWPKGLLRSIGWGYYFVAQKKPN